MSGEVDWAALFRVAVLRLGLSPRDAWNLSPAELSMLLGADASAPLDRAALDALMAAHPDAAGDIQDER
mgnify:FL=1